MKYFHPADHHPARIIKADKTFVKELDFIVIKFQAKIRDIYKIKKKIVYLVNETEVKYLFNLCVKKCEDKHVDLLLDRRRRQKNTMFISNNSICMITH